MAWPARLLTALRILLAILGAAAAEAKSEGYAVLSAALLASIVLGLRETSQYSNLISEPHLKSRKRC